LRLSWGNRVNRDNRDDRDNGVDWRWSGLEKKMKWIGLEWRKGGEIGEKSSPQPHFLTKTHKTPFPTK